MIKLIFLTSSIFFLKNYLFFNFNWFILFSLMTMYFINNYYFINNIYFNFSVDFISLNLIILTMWILSLSILSNFNFLKNMFKYKYMNLILFMNLFMILCFSSMNLFMFYFFFESTLIPIMILIMGWGNQIDRIQASMYMLFYTLFGSLPLLMMIIYIYNFMYSLNMMFLFMMNFIQLNYNFYLYIFLSLAFLIKMPMYFFHLWLPKAHVESPISGSMILAGIMLKLGSYGLLRLMTIFPMLFLKYNLYIMIFSIWGGILSTFICMNLNDLKIIVAYSSIVHMSLLMTSMMTLFKWSLLGSLMMMISHGLNSSIMFCLVNFNYERINSRNLFMNKGKINYLPNLSLWWFLICISNMSAPPSLNFFSEILLINSLINFSIIFMIFLIFMIFFNSMFNIFLYSHTQNTKFNSSNMNFYMISIREILIIMIHYYPLILLFMYMYMYN